LLKYFLFFCPEEQAPLRTDKRQTFSCLTALTVPGVPASLPNDSAIISAAEKTEAGS
jgi:hypothetical protein